MRRLICMLFGHEPRGPVVTEPVVLYKCDRCKRIIYFDSIKHRWLINYYE